MINLKKTGKLYLSKSYHKTKNLVNKKTQFDKKCESFCIEIINKTLKMKNTLTESRICDILNNGFLGID